MPRYLVVLDLPSGIAQLDNVLVVEAQSHNDAKSVALKMCGLVGDTYEHFHPFRLDEIEPNWSYYA